MKIRKLLMTVCPLALCLHFALPAFAATNADLDLDACGSITITMKHEGNAVTGAQWTAYRVGEVCNDDWNLSFVPASGFESVSFADISSTDLPDKLLEILNSMNEKPYGWTSLEVSPGVYCCEGDEGMPLGLYLMVQTRAAPGYRTANAFLVTIPQSDGGRWVYDVEAVNKPQTGVDPEPNPPKPTEPPETPSLIQTGQLNWPIPVLAGLGLVLMLLGLALLRGRRKTK